MLSLSWMFREGFSSSFVVNTNKTRRLRATETSSSTWMLSGLSFVLTLLALFSEGRFIMENNNNFMQSLGIVEQTTAHRFWSDEIRTAKLLTRKRKALASLDWRWRLSQSVARLSLVYYVKIYFLMLMVGVLFPLFNYAFLCLGKV